MKLLTWNCNGALRKKFHLLEGFDADIILVQECEDPAQSADTAYQQWAVNYLWQGDRKHKGQAIFAKPHISLERLDWPVAVGDGTLKHFIPCLVEQSYVLLAVWTHQNKGVANPYVGQLWAFLQLHAAKLGANALLAGDFNSNAYWDKPRRDWNHSDVVRLLANRGVHSCYHLQYEEAHGQESTPTFYLTKKLEKPYHIDYVFAAQPWVSRFSQLSIGQPTDWLRYSDHMPLFVSFDK